MSCCRVCCVLWRIVRGILSLWARLHQCLRHGCTRLSMHCLPPILGLGVGSIVAVAVGVARFPHCAKSSVARAWRLLIHDSPSPPPLCRHEMTSVSGSPGAGGGVIGEGCTNTKGHGRVVKQQQRAAPRPGWNLTIIQYREDH